MKNTLILAGAVLASTLISQAAPGDPLVLVNDDFSTSSTSTGARFGTDSIGADSSAQNWDQRTDGTWSITGGALTNTGVTNDAGAPADSDQGVHLVNTVTSSDTSLTSITVSFDYTVATGSTLYFYSHLLNGALDGTGNLMRMSGSGGNTFAADLTTNAASQTFYTGDVLVLSDGAAAGTVNGDNADALFSIVGSGAATATFTQTYNIAGFTGIDSIADVSAITAFFAADTLTSGTVGAFSIDNVNITAVVPEPSTYALLAGLTGLVFVMVRRRRA